jgi:uncharacterized protein YbjT (DUF2867 family)
MFKYFIMKILIIGASGMLAKPVIQELDNKGFQLRLFSRNVNQSMFSKDYEIVNGDVFDPNDLEKAVKGCDAIHISLSWVNEEKAAKEIVRVASNEGIKLISTISGCTVSEENRWFPMIDDKFKAEQHIIQSGIPYMIFRATWFFESLELMVRNGKATMIGKQNHPYHWIAANDYARMVGDAYLKPEAKNKIFYVLGQEPYLMKDLLNKYCEVQHPEIKKINTVSTGMLKFIAMISGKKALKTVAEMFRYFEKTKEQGNTEETYSLLGKPQISFEKWLYLKD